MALKKKGNGKCYSARFLKVSKTGVLIPIVLTGRHSHTVLFLSVSAMGISTTVLLIENVRYVDSYKISTLLRVTVDLESDGIFFQKWIMIHVSNIEDQEA